MITAIVQYRLPPSIDLEACAEHFRKIAPGFRTVPGLIRKQFIYAEDGWAGGVYLWETRADAEAFYSGPWLAGIRERYGMDPDQVFPDCLCDRQLGRGGAGSRRCGIGQGFGPLAWPKGSDKPGFLANVNPLTTI
jgi:hypothetical protein